MIGTESARVIGTEVTFHEGQLVTVDCLEWIDPYWDFDNPCVVLRPIYREFETTHTDGAIEDVLLDVVSAVTIVRKFDINRWNERYLCRVFDAALKGKKFPERNYKATRAFARITCDAHGLNWEFE